MSTINSIIRIPRQNSHGQGVFPLFSSLLELYPYLFVRNKIQLGNVYYKLRYSPRDLENAQLILQNFTKDINPDINHIIRKLYMLSEPDTYNLEFRLNSLKNNSLKKKLIIWLYDFAKNISERGDQILISLSNGKTKNILINILFETINEIIEKLNKICEIKKVYSYDDLNNLIIYRGVFDAVLIYILRLFTNTNFMINLESDILNNQTHNILMSKLLEKIHSANFVSLKKNNLLAINNFKIKVLDNSLPIIPFKNHLGGKKIKNNNKKKNKNKK